MGGAALVPAVPMLAAAETPAKDDDHQRNWRRDWAALHPYDGPQHTPNKLIRAGLFARAGALRGEESAWHFQQGMSGYEVQQTGSDWPHCSQLMGTGMLQKVTGLYGPRLAAAWSYGMKEHDAQVLGLAIRHGHWSMAEWLMTKERPVYNDECLVNVVECGTFSGGGGYDTVFSSFVVDLVEGAVSSGWEWGIRHLVERTTCPVHNGTPGGEHELISNFRDTGWYRAAFIVGAARAGNAPQALHWAKHFAVALPPLDRPVPRCVQMLPECAAKCSLRTAEWVLAHFHGQGQGEGDGGSSPEAPNVGSELQGRAFLLQAIRSAATAGNMPVLEWLFSQPYDKTEAAKVLLIDTCARNGHFDVVRLLHSRGVGVATHRAMDSAAMIGQLDMVEFLHAHRSEGCTTAAMDAAAHNGHLSVVEFLHRWRTEGCTTRAMDGAAAGGHLSVVRWLHFHRREGCTTDAMDRAAIVPSLPTIEFLHAHRTEGCTKLAMTWAIERGGRDGFAVLKWLHRNRSEGCSQNVLWAPVYEADLDMVEWIYQNRPGDVTITETLMKSAAMKNSKPNAARVLAFLERHYQAPPADSSPPPPLTS